jgi:hypothetical protein
MGTWGPDSFENDAAADWADELSRAEDIGPIAATLRAILDARGYVEVDEGGAAVAAAEVVAALCGKASRTLPDRVRTWMEQHPTAVDEDLRRAALYAVTRIETDSELRDLWEEGDGTTEWRTILAELRARLEQCSTTRKPPKSRIVTSRKRVRPGDVICVPLRQGLVTVGIVLHVSKVFNGGMLVGFFDQTFTSPQEVDIKALGGPFIWTPNYTGTQLVREGRWTVVGNSPELLATANMPDLRVVSTVYRGDTIVRDPVPLEEWGNYQEVRGGGGRFVEDRLREYFDSIKHKTL